MSSSQQKLLSLIVATSDKNKLDAFLDHIKVTIHDPDAIEILIKTTLNISLQGKHYPFEVRFAQMIELNDCQGYFIGLVSDRVRFKTQKWDQVISSYVNFYEDDVFRLKISPFKYENYYSHHDCSLTPESYPVMTRKWLQFCGGINSTYPESWYQQIDYHLGQTEGLEGIRGLFRSIPLEDLIIEEVGSENITPEEKHLLSQKRWSHYQINAQQEFRRIATQIMAYVWAKSTHLDTFEIVDDQASSRLVVNEKSFYYYLSPQYILFENLSFLIKLFQYPMPGMIKAFIFPASLPETRWKRWVNYFIRMFLVLLSMPVSLFYVNENSSSKWSFKNIFKKKKSAYIGTLIQE